ncbi:MAG: pyridoxamine kinase [Lachnospiraceae bacterium]|nr:pyridoxamine kinase [Lachnospiraceae bacterium]
MTKRVAVINDLSGFGKCSLTAAIAVLSAMGVQPCPMPTAVLTNQSGFPIYHSVDFTDNMDSYLDAWQKNNAEFNGIYSGYITNDKQIDYILRFINTFRRKDTVVIVDPVMADNGVKYRAYNELMCLKMRDLAAKADFITPNLTEICILTDNSFDEVACLNGDALLKKISEMAMSLVQENNQIVIVTGVPDDNSMCNCIFSKETKAFVRNKLYKGSYSGTGDIFASVFCGGIINGMSAEKAVELAGCFLEKSLADTIVIPDRDRNHGVEFEKNLSMLLNLQ